MFRNYFVAALRNLAHNKLDAAINIISLAVGFATAILIVLYVRDEFSYDKWVPGYERIYLLTQTIENAGHSPAHSYATSNLTARLRQDVPFIEAMANLSVKFDVSVRHTGVEANETIQFADPNFFDLLPLPAIVGDLRTALARPDGVVLTRSIARKYFGRDDVVGETIDVDRKYPLRVTAIIEDMPSNTHLNVGVIGSSLAAIYSPTFNRDRPAPYQNNKTYTYLRLTPATSVQQREQAMVDFVHREFPKIKYKEGFSLVPLADVHFQPDNSSSAMKPADDPTVAYAMMAIGVLIVLVACINFVNLMTARATRRALEVGIRKVTGAFRRDLMLQFMGEAVLYAFLSMGLAVVLVENLLPLFNAFLDRTTVFEYAHAANIFGALVAATVTIGALAGFYPALLLSAFRPAVAFKKNIFQTAGAGMLRTVLVMVQFSVLIGLIVATLVIVRQTRFALNEGLRIDKDQVLLISTECRAAFIDRVRAVRGVRAAACSNAGLEFLKEIALLAPPLGPVSTEDVDYGFFELYGLKPVAGRFFSQDHGGDALAAHPLNLNVQPTAIVINEAAVRPLGFTSPSAAIGGGVKWAPKEPPMEIIGVVPDFSWDSIRAVVPPSFYYNDPSRFKYLNVKLSGRDIPETLSAINQIWKEVGDPKPITIQFLDQGVQALYLDITRQGQIFEAFSAIGVLVACLGLIGLTIATAERRTKEIGIRKSMGATNGDILRLLTWELVKPVLWANLIAWPIAYYAMNRWLSGFAYHVPLDPGLFVGAAVLAFAVALLTVAGQVIQVARQKPVLALRYE